MTTKEIIRIVAENHGQTVEELEQEIKACVPGDMDNPSMTAHAFIERLVRAAMLIGTLYE